MRWRLTSGLSSRKAEVDDRARSQDRARSLRHPNRADPRRRDAEEARKAAAELLGSYSSLVVKILSPDITHKSDIGGVRLDLKSAEDVEKVTRQMLADIQALRPSAKLQGVTVQPRVRRRDALEVILGITFRSHLWPGHSVRRGRNCRRSHWRHRHGADPARPEACNGPHRIDSHFHRLLKATTTSLGSIWRGSPSAW